MTDEGYTIGGRPVNEERLRNYLDKREERWGDRNNYPGRVAWGKGHSAGCEDRDSDALTLPKFWVVDELAAHMKFLEWSPDDPAKRARSVFSSYLDGYHFGKRPMYGIPNEWVQERKDLEAKLWEIYGPQYEKKELRPPGEESPRIPEPQQPKGMWAWVQNAQSWFKGPPSPLQEWSRALKPAEVRGNEKGQNPQSPGVYKPLPTSPKLSEKSAPSELSPQLSAAADPAVSPSAARPQSVATAANGLLPPGSTNRATRTASVASAPPTDHTAKKPKKPRLSQ